MAVGQFVLIATTIGAYDPVVKRDISASTVVDA